MAQFWTKLEQILEMRSPWFTRIGERLRDDRDRTPDSWQVEPANSGVMGHPGPVPASSPP